MQVMPLLIEASKQNVKFNLKEIALFASSHSGQEEHTDFLHTVANKYEISLDNLGSSNNTSSMEESKSVLESSFGGGIELLMNVGV